MAHSLHGSHFEYIIYSMICIPIYINNQSQSLPVMDYPRASRSSTRGSQARGTRFGSTTFKMSGMCLIACTPFMLTCLNFVKCFAVWLCCTFPLWLTMLKYNKVFRTEKLVMAKQKQCLKKVFFPSDQAHLMYENSI